MSALDDASTAAEMTAAAWDDVDVDI